MYKTTDGYSWTPLGGIQRGGFNCEGVIVPATRKNAPSNFVYDVVVVGGGYAGLSAARDLTIANHSVLLLEGRDRIGGRAYSIEIDGFQYEMGGTWVSHYQPHTFAELRRYNLDLDLVRTRQHGYKNDYYTINMPGASPRNCSHEEAEEVFLRVWHKFINIDGQKCRKICPLPFQQLGNIAIDRAEVEKWDRLSCWDRFQQIEKELNTEERGLLVTQLLMLSGGNLKNSSLWDMIRSQALTGHDFKNHEDIWIMYKLKKGQSHLGRKIFDEAVGRGLDYQLRTRVTGIRNTSFCGENIVEVVSEQGQVHRARRVICTVPLNVLKGLHFDPPLSPVRRDAVEQGHICFMTKVHADARGTGLASWAGAAYPNNLLLAFGDSLTPAGDTHITAFGGDERSHFVPERDQDQILEALQKLHPMEVVRTVFHNWNTDPFANGGPCFWPPEYMTKYQEELQARHGNIFFASGDWADGWRAFIDGALEQGRKKALEIMFELQSMKEPHVRI